MHLKRLALGNALTDVLTLIVMEHVRNISDSSRNMMSIAT